MLGMLGHAGRWTATCGGCGKEMRAGNLARHQRGACRVWDSGGGGKPLKGVEAQWMDAK